MTTLFAHRGIINKERNIKENTIQSLEEAIRLGFKAIEFDIWFSDSNLFINHDNPKSTNFLPTLQEYLKFGDKLTYWMDFKNMNEDNIHKILPLLDQAIKTHNIPLKQIYFAPFIDQYDKAEIILEKIKNHFKQQVNIVAICSTKENLDEVIELTKKNNIKNLSIQHELINHNTINKLNHLTLFAWTVNDLKQAKYLESLNIKNIATDTLLPNKS